MKLFLPNSAHLGNFEGFIKQIDSAVPSRLDLRFNERWVSVHPLALAMTACLGSLVRDGGGVIDAEVPRIPTLPYLIRMGLFEHLGIDPGMQVTKHEAAGRFIPLIQITDREQLREFIVETIPLLHASPAEVEPIKYVLSETIRNTLEHSGSSVGALVCAQYFQDTGRLSIGVADAGQGILNSMRTFHAVADSREAIALSLRPGVTGVTSRYGGNEYNAGAGLFFTKAIACESRHFFLLYSGDALFKLRKTPVGSQIVLNANPEDDIATWRSELPTWPGTALGIDLSLESHRSFERLLSEIRDVYHLNVSTRKKARYKKARFG